ncbi:hypothetical protein A2Y85_08105 [candidate division WOR-3 bacterium RBG_13_43_14]|uniref:Outer membrane protein beta-barrel domain-containing protein n=1 Tax=candidate division WOR-3 bacterium RBG_13_43_14 TaxID=1802590 RepID=A0A1F4UBF4_UNCW3|nr:MAG: hypothetical protein A2Y85_08105 [candidate division WOR-3 bacterium RBG_13_43_14]
MFLANRLSKAFLIILCTGFIYASGFEIDGDGKLRMRFVEADRETLSGTYGEALKTGFSFRERLDLYAALPITNFLRIEAGIRISNEEVSSVHTPPEYVSAMIPFAWWSVVLKRGSWQGTIGSYEISFTPLTLMRWDLKDNPLAASGCGCQVSVGGIDSETLEEPREDYQFEGCKLEYAKSLIDLKGTFARCQFAEPGNTYARYLAGGRIRLVPELFNRVLVLGITGLRLTDDPQSVTVAIEDPLCSDVLGADVVIPIIGSFNAIGEYAYSIRDDNLNSSAEAIRYGNGIIGGINLAHEDRINADLLYLRLDPYFSPFYRSLSYARNRQGFRTSFVYRGLPVFSRQTTVSAYLKYWQEIKPTWNNAISEWHHSLADFLIGTMALNLSVFSDLKSEFSYEYRRTQRDDDQMSLADEGIDKQTMIFGFQIIYEFTFQTKAVLRYQYINENDNIGSEAFKAHIPSLQISVRF